MATEEAGAPRIVDAYAVACEACGRGAVLEIAADGSWVERCQHCGAVQLGLPGFPPPEQRTAPGAVALGLPL